MEGSDTAMCLSEWLTWWEIKIESTGIKSREIESTWLKSREIESTGLKSREIESTGLKSREIESSSETESRDIVVR